MDSFSIILIVGMLVGSSLVLTSGIGVYFSSGESHRRAIAFPVAVMCAVSVIGIIIGMVILAGSGYAFVAALTANGTILISTAAFNKARKSRAKESLK